MGGDDDVGAIGIEEGRDIGGAHAVLVDDWNYDTLSREHVADSDDAPGGNDNNHARQEISHLTWRRGFKSWFRRKLSRR